MNIRDVIRESWFTLTFKQRVISTVITLGLIVLVATSFYGWFGSWNAIRKLEREKTAANRDAEDALKKAADIARQKIEVDKQLAEVEVKRDEKITEIEKKRVEDAANTVELNRVVRERRTDNPSPEQLCAELAAAGYPC